QLHLDPHGRPRAGQELDMGHGTSTLRCRRALIMSPRAEQTTEMCDELLVLMGRERVLHRVHDDPIEILALHPGDGELIDMREMPVAEFAIPVDLELVIRKLPISGELLLV